MKSDRMQGVAVSIAVVSGVAVFGVAMALAVVALVVRSVMP